MANSNPYQLIDSDVTTYMRKVRQELQGLIQMGNTRHGQLAEGDFTLQGIWYDDVPTLARTAADAYGYAPTLFAGSPCDSAQLRQMEEEVRVTGEFLTFLEATVRQVRSIHNAGRKTLCDWTYGITDQILGLEKLPFVPAEQKALVSDVAPLIHKVFDGRAANKQTTKVNNLKIKEMAEAQTAEVTAQLAHKEREIAVLRGSSLELPQASAPAPKKTRRSRRTAR